MYDRFIYAHLLYCSTSYATGKRHNNSCILFDHPDYMYSVIVGLLVIKPYCQCSTINLQYCTCAKYALVIVKPKLVTNRVLCKDMDFGAESHFVVPVDDMTDLIALFPTHIKRKCVCLKAPRTTYFCPVPYRIYGD